MSAGIRAGIGRALSLQAERRYQDRVREAERAERKAEIADSRAHDINMFNRRLLEERRYKILDTIGTWTDSRRETDAKVSKAVGIGLSKESATSLLRSGQLDLLLEKYDSNKKADPQFISDLDTFIRTQLTDADQDTKEKILLEGVSTDRDVSDPRESMQAIVEATLSATSPEQLDDLFVKLKSVGTYTPLPSFDVDFSTLGGADLSETAAMDKEIARGLSTYFKGSFIINPATGDLIVNKESAGAPVVQGILNEAQRKARELSFGPTREYTPTSAANYVVTQVESAIRGTQGRVKPEDILTNFDTILSNPVDFAQTYVPAEIPVPASAKSPEEDVENLGDTGFSFDLGSFR